MLHGYCAVSDMIVYQVPNRLVEGQQQQATMLLSDLFFFFFLNSYFYPGWHPYGQAGWLSTTQVLKGSLLLESGRYREGEKEIVRKATKSGSQLAKCPEIVHCARRQKHSIS